MAVLGQPTTLGGCCFQVLMVQFFVPALPLALHCFCCALEVLTANHEKVPHREADFACTIMSNKKQHISTNVVVLDK